MVPTFRNSGNTGGLKPGPGFSEKGAKQGGGWRNSHDVPYYQPWNGAVEQETASFATLNNAFNPLRTRALALCGPATTHTSTAPSRTGTASRKIIRTNEVEPVSSKYFVWVDRHTELSTLHFFQKTVDYPDYPTGLPEKDLDPFTLRRSLDT